MEKLNEYRELVQNVLKRYAEYKVANGEIETQLIFDTERDHYQLFHVGWENKHRVFGCVFHIDIKDDKIWIQQDATDVGIVEEFVQLGVPKEDIVLAFYAPNKRKFTDYAVA